MYSVLESMASKAEGDGAAGAGAGPSAKKQRTDGPGSGGGSGGGGGSLDPLVSGLDAQRKLLPAVSQHEVTAATLQARLTEYIERIDTDMVN